MFSAKLAMLFFGFIVVATALTSVEAMPVDEYDSPINDIDNDAFEEEISADKSGVFDGEEVEEGEGEERNFLDELDAAVDEEAEEEANEEEIEEEIAEDDVKNGADEEEFEEEVADAEEESEESEGDEDDDEAKAVEEEHGVSEEEEAAAEEEEEAIAEEEEVDEERGFPYTWYDKVKKFFKGEK